MANGPKDFRDPKVTSKTAAGSGGAGKWIAIAVGVLLLLLILAWLLGLFADDTDELSDTSVDTTLESTTAPIDDAPGTAIAPEGNDAATVEN